MSDKERIERIRKIVEDGIKYGFELNPHTIKTALDWDQND